MRVNLPQPEQFSAIFETIMGEKLNRPVSGVSIDSRNIHEGDLFIAIKGEEFDGHDYLENVNNDGAVAAIVKEKYINIEIQQIRIKDPIIALAKIANEYREQYNLPIVGITGSNGKTSTKELLKHVLSKQFNVHSTLSNQNTLIGLSLNLLRISNQHDISILEIGASKKGEIKRICKVAQPTHGLITNISSAHLEGFGSIKNIANEKAELFKNLNGGIAFVNSADQYVSKIKFKCKKINFGFKPSCDFSADISKENDGTLTLILNTNIIPTFSFNLSFLKNLIAVSAVAITLGLEWRDLKKQVKTFSPPGGRCKIFKKDSITIIDDTYNANLASSLASLDYLKAFSSKGRKVFVFGDMYELGNSSKRQHRIVGEKCSELGIDAVFTLGDHSKETNFALNQKNNGRHFFSRTELVKTLKQDIQPGDVILFKGSRGMAMEKVLKGAF